MINEKKVIKTFQKVGMEDEISIKKSLDSLILMEDMIMNGDISDLLNCGKLNVETIKYGNKKEGIENKSFAIRAVDINNYTHSTGAGNYRYLATREKGFYALARHKSGNKYEVVKRW